MTCGVQNAEGLLDQALRVFGLVGALLVVMIEVHARAFSKQWHCCECIMLKQYTKSVRLDSDSLPQCLFAQLTAGAAAFVLSICNCFACCPGGVGAIPAALPLC